MSRQRDPNRPRCIVCDKPIAKRYTIIWFQRSREAIPNGTWINQTLYLDDPPKTKEDAQRWSNYPLDRIIGHHNGYISGAQFWDGESYMDRFFDKDKCAVRQGYASANYGDRFNWKTTP